MKSWRPEELEEIGCNHCGSREVAVEYVRKDGMRVVECAVCGLAYLNPRPVERLIPRFYDQDYFTGAAADRGEGGLRARLGEVGGAAPPGEDSPVPPAVRIVESHCGGVRGKRILEIGCATGDLLARLAAAGAICRGLEISDFAAGAARERGLEVTTGTLDDYAPSASERYDVVLAFEVIEHVTDPARFLSLASGLLAPGGALLLSTPNYGCASRFGAAWFGFNESFEHIHFFGLEVLKRMAVRAGLSLRYWETSDWDGGPSPPAPGAASRRFGPAYRAIRKLGIGRRALASLRNRIVEAGRHRPYGTGHTLVVLFGKR
jgi:2-polyprenyl-3-methyl-5-hydroxy-6-metoxy-1,4-benzoquinol methylase